MTILLNFPCSSSRLTTDSLMDLQLHLASCGQGPIRAGSLPKHLIFWSRLKTGVGVSNQIVVKFCGPPAIRKMSDRGVLCNAFSIVRKFRPPSFAENL